jgi:SAM-dependent methyltransferase
VIIPWLDRTRRLPGVRVCEIGCGTGISALALAEQGAIVTGLDLSPESVRTARDRLARHRLDATFVVANGADIRGALEPEAFDWIIYWATLEHMTLDERLKSLAAAWDHLDSGGLLTVVETPNRLWFFDSHTSRLPFFMWLPDELAYRTSSDSERIGFGDVYTDTELTHLADFLRRGRGVSYHEFDVALGKRSHDCVVSCLQLERRRRSPLRRLGWRLSRAGRYESILASVAPTLPRCYLQPMLYVTLQKP